MTNTTLSSFQKNMGLKPLPYPKSQIKFVFYDNSPFHHHPNIFFQKLFFLNLFIRFDLNLNQIGFIYWI
jgi:hypothetical protein